MERTRTTLDDLGVFALMAKALTLQPLGYDPVQHGDHAPRPPAPVPTLPRRGLLERLDDWFWKHEQREREAYLAASTDIYDLEARIRNLERGVPYRCY
jgi:hypothetical protein